jgi:hypothetical protein
MFALVVAAVGVWAFAAERDPMGQTVYVASIAPDPERPFVGLKYLCGGVTGVVFQFNLGEVEYEGSQFSTDEPTSEDVKFVFLEGTYDSTAKRAPIVDGLATYEIKGSEAAFVVGLMKDSESVTVSRGEASFQFSLSGARGAIDEVTLACPFKYPET